MQTNPWNPYVQAALKRLLPRRVYLRYIGRHEQGSIRLWRELARSVACERVIIDIGAFRGEFALAARAENARCEIYAFEPNPTSWALLRESVHGKDIQIEKLAVSERQGIVTFAMQGERSQISESGDVRVESVRFDDWCRLRGLKPALIKIDAEGAEPGIIQGAREIILQWKPTIICEVLTDDAGSRVMSALPEYRYLRIHEDRGVEERLRITRDSWRHKNWLLVPR